MLCQKHHVRCVIDKKMNKTQSFPQSPNRIHRAYGDLEKHSDLPKIIKNTIQHTLKPIVYVIYDATYELCCIQ